MSDFSFILINIHIFLNINYADNYLRQITDDKRFKNLWWVAEANVSECILPLRKTEVDQHHSIVEEKGFGQEMPSQATIQEPHICILGRNACKENNFHY